MAHPGIPPPPPLTPSAVRVESVLYWNTTQQPGQGQNPARQPFGRRFSYNRKECIYFIFPVQPFHLLQLVSILILHLFNDSFFQNLQIQNFLRILQFDSINRVSMAVTIGRPHWKDINHQPQIGQYFQALAVKATPHQDPLVNNYTTTATCRFYSKYYFR